MNSKAKSVIFFIYLAALVAEAALGNIFGMPLAERFMIDALVLLGLSVAVMAVMLAGSVKKTIYSYANVGYIGGILFLSMLFVALICRFVPQLLTDSFSPRDILTMLTEFPWQFARVAVPIMFVVVIVLGVSNVALIRHEGLRAKNLLSVILGALYIGGTVAIWASSRLLEKYVLTDSGAKIHTVLNTFIPLFFILMMCYLECVLVGCAVMGYAATRKEPAHDKDFIIILGCSIDKKGGLLPLLKARTNRAIRFAWDQEIECGKKCLFVPSGGQGANEIMSEGSAMELYLLSHGAESDEVFPERESADTYENMLFSKQIIDKIKPGAKIAFATTNFHVFRSGIIARMAGIDAEGVSSRTKWYFWPNGFIREFFGILAINKKAHIVTAAATAVLCAVLGTVTYMIM